MKQRLAKSTDLIRNAYKMGFGQGRIFRDDYNTHFKKTLYRRLEPNQFSPYQSSVITGVSMLLHSGSASQFPYFLINHPYVSPDTGKRECKLNFSFQSPELLNVIQLTTLETDSGSVGPDGPWSFTNIDLLRFLKSV